MSKTDLGHLGIGRRRLVLDSSKIAHAVSAMNEPLVEEVQSLRNRILDIYKHVNMDVSYHMIFHGSNDMVFQV